MLDARQPVLYVLGPAVRRHEHRRDLIGVVRNQLPQAAQQIAVGGGVAAFLDLVEQPDIVARIDERATIESRPSGGSLLQRDAAADCDMRRIEQKDAHGDLKRQEGG